MRGHEGGREGVEVQACTASSNGRVTAHKSSMNNARMPLKMQQ